MTDNNGNGISIATQIEELLLEYAQNKPTSGKQLAELLRLIGQTGSYPYFRQPQVPGTENNPPPLPAWLLRPSRGSAAQESSGRGFGKGQLMRRKAKGVHPHWQRMAIVATAVAGVSTACAGYLANLSREDAKNIQDTTEQLRQEMGRAALLAGYLKRAKVVINDLYNVSEEAGEQLRQEMGRSALLAGYLERANDKIYTLNLANDQLHSRLDGMQIVQYAAEKDANVAKSEVAKLKSQLDAMQAEKDATAKDAAAKQASILTNDNPDLGNLYDNTVSLVTGKLPVPINEMTKLSGLQGAPDNNQLASAADQSAGMSLDNLKRANSNMQCDVKAAKLGKLSDRFAVYEDLDGVCRVLGIPGNLFGKPLVSQSPSAKVGGVKSKSATRPAGTSRTSVLPDRAP